jgi:MerR family transcriptional regulator/heat shock protein HspR
VSEREPGAGYGQTPEAAVEYRVEVVCRMLRLSPAKLRRYEAHGLVEPRRRGRARVYDESGLQRLRRVRRLTEDLGVNLAGVGIILRLVDELAELRRRG